MVIVDANTAISNPVAAPVMRLYEHGDYPTAVDVLLSDRWSGENTLELLLRLNMFATIRKVCEQALLAYRPGLDLTKRWELERYLAIVHLDEGELGPALHMLDSNLEDMRQTFAQTYSAEVALQTARSMLINAKCLQLMGQLEPALRSCDSALVILRQLGSRLDVAKALYMKTTICADQQDGNIIEDLTKALSIAYEIRALPTQYDILLMLTSIFVSQSNPEQASIHYNATLKVIEQLIAEAAVNNSEGKVEAAHYWQDRWMLLRREFNRVSR